MSMELAQEMSGEITAKYGGSSVDDQVALGQSLQPEIILAVVSAPKAEQPNGDKATDIYIGYGQTAIKGEHDNEAHEKLRAINEHTFRDLGSSLMRALMVELDDQLSVEKNRHRGPAWYAGIGEYISAKGSAMLHDGRFIDSLIVFKNGIVNYEATFRKIAMARAAGEIGSGQIAFEPGFYGHDETGNRVLLGRGGSDRSGVLSAIGLGTDNWNMTDVDGIYSGNPKLIPGAVLLGSLARLEVREGAHGGSGVLQGDTITDLDYAPSLLVAH